MGKRIAVVGTRFTPLHGRKWEERIREFVESLPDDVELVTIGAPGTDRTAAEYARRRGLKVTLMFPDAGYSDDPRYFVHRNTRLVQEADEVHAFWDGQSAGTRHAIAAARHMKVPVVVHYVHDQEWELVK